MKIYPLHSTLFHGIDLALANIDSSVEICDASGLGQDDLNQKNPQRSILASQDFEPAQVVATMAKNNFRSFVQKRESHFVTDLNLSARLLLDPATYFSHGGRSAISDVQREFEFKFRSAADKSELKKAVELFVSEIASDNVSESVEAVLEELYMNAILDAPKEALNQGQANCTYEPDKSAVIRIYQSDSRLAVVCEDPFGSLNLAKLITRMDEVYQKGAGSAIRLDEGSGAGIGCMMMFEHCESLFLGVMPGEKTLVTCLIPLNLSNRKRAQIKKSLHLIYT